MTVYVRFANPICLIQAHTWHFAVRVLTPKNNTKKKTKKRKKKRMMKGPVRSSSTTVLSDINYLISLRAIKSGEAEYCFSVVCVCMTV